MIVAQGGSSKFGGSIDDYNPSPEVFEADGLTPASTESITCEGTTPSDGINCNYGTLGASMTGGFYAEGAVDPTAPYCKHLPTNAAGKTIDKPGTVAIPKAAVYLVATDTTGGQNGPFLLGATRRATNARRCRTSFRPRSPRSQGPPRSQSPNRMNSSAPVVSPTATDAQSTPKENQR